MGKRVRKLTARRLKSIIMDEARKLQKETLEQGKDDSEKVNAEETEASELAGSLEKDIDYMKALKIHEARLQNKLNQIKEARNTLRKRIAKRI